MRKTNEMVRGTDKRNYEDDWETDEMLDLLDVTMDQAVPIPKEMFEDFNELWAKAEENRKREVAVAKPTNITLEQAFAIAFERYEDTLQELSKN